MKSLKKKIANSKYPEDHKEVLQDYRLKNAMIEKYNKDESNISKNRQNEKIYIQ